MAEGRALGNRLYLLNKQYNNPTIILMNLYGVELIYNQIIIIFLDEHF